MCASYRSWLAPFLTSPPLSPCFAAQLLCPYCHQVDPPSFLTALSAAAAITSSTLAPSSTTAAARSTAFAAPPAPPPATTDWIQCSACPRWFHACCARLMGDGGNGDGSPADGNAVADGGEGGGVGTRSSDETTQGTATTVAAEAASKRPSFVCAVCREVSRRRGRQQRRSGRRQGSDKPAEATKDWTEVGKQKSEGGDGEEGEAAEEAAGEGERETAVEARQVQLCAAVLDCVVPAQDKIKVRTHLPVFAPPLRSGDPCLCVPSLAGLEVLIADPRLL